MTPTIRVAAGDDWAAIWPIMREVVRAGETYNYPRDLDENAGRELWMLTAPGRTVVATDGAGAVVGTAKMNPNFMPGGGSDHVASASFMVDVRAAGTGVGRALGRYVLEWAAAEGYRAMQFNAVVETNSRAVALWRSLGFEVVGTLPGAFRHPVHGYVGLHVMHRPL